MKKTALILLLTVYTLFVFGSDTTAFCSCSQPGSATEKKETSSKNTACCGNQEATVLFNTVHVASTPAHFAVRPFAWVLQANIPGFLPDQAAAQSYTITHPEQSLQEYNSVPIYILHCVYRI